MSWLTLKKDRVMEKKGKKKKKSDENIEFYLHISSQRKKKKSSKYSKQNYCKMKIKRKIKKNEYRIPKYYLPTSHSAAVK